MSNNADPLNLRVGDLVEVKSLDEILATLDPTGRFEGLPFMPEMIPHCGKRFRVFKRAEKTCDTVAGSGMLRVLGCVHLEEIRCNGEAHGGCEAGCLVYWKEAWLRKVQPDGKVRISGSSVNGKTSSCSVEDLMRATRDGLPAGAPEQEKFSCQLTDMRKFTVPLPWWDLRQYVRDSRCGNVPVGTLLRSIAISVFNSIQKKRQGRMIPHIQGKHRKSPVQQLNLQPGELVTIKTLAEVEDTLHVDEHNRGLTFDREMVKFCGGQFRVLKRVTKIINEKTGYMLPMKGECIVLDGVVCGGEYHRFCSRSSYPFWREIWLKRAGSVSASSQYAGHRE